MPALAEHQFGRLNGLELRHEFGGPATRAFFPSAAEDPFAQHHPVARAFYVLFLFVDRAGHRPAGAVEVEGGGWRASTSLLRQRQPLTAPTISTDRPMLGLQYLPGPGRRTGTMATASSPPAAIDVGAKPEPLPSAHPAGVPSLVPYRWPGSEGTLAPTSTVEAWSGAAAYRTRRPRREVASAAERRSGFGQRGVGQRLDPGQCEAACSVAQPVTRGQTPRGPCSSSSVSPSSSHTEQPSGGRSQGHPKTACPPSPGCRPSGCRTRQPSCRVAPSPDRSASPLWSMTVNTFIPFDSTISTRRVTVSLDAAGADLGDHAVHVVRSRGRHRRASLRSGALARWIVPDRWVVRRPISLEPRGRGSPKTPKAQRRPLPIQLQAEGVNPDEPTKTVERGRVATDAVDGRPALAVGTHVRHSSP